MKVPRPDWVPGHTTVHRPETLAWWILKCDGTPSELRVVAYTILNQLPLLGLDNLLKEVVRYIVYGYGLKHATHCQNCHAGPFIRLVGHHINYQRPLDVYWLCNSCHSSIHGSGANWLSTADELRPACPRDRGTYRTRRFPLLDALWQLREELAPLEVERMIALKDCLSARRKAAQFDKPTEKLVLPNPYATILRKAHKRGELMSGLVELAEKFGS